MNRLISWKNALAAVVVAAGLVSLGNTSEAGGLCRRPVTFVSTYDFPPPCRYETVIDFELRPVEYTECVTRFTPCGRPYHVDVVRTKLVKVPVRRLVKVCY